jgi:hypothetical protein
MTGVRRGGDTATPLHIATRLGILRGPNCHAPERESLR